MNAENKNFNIKANHILHEATTLALVGGLALAAGAEAEPRQRSVEVPIAGKERIITSSAQTGYELDGNVRVRYNKETHVLSAAVHQESEDNTVTQKISYDKDTKMITYSMAGSGTFTSWESPTIRADKLIHTDKGRSWRTFASTDIAAQVVYTKPTFRTYDEKITRKLTKAESEHLKADHLRLQSKTSFGGMSLLIRTNKQR